MSVCFSRRGLLNATKTWSFHIDSLHQGLTDFELICEKQPAMVKSDALKKLKNRHPEWVSPSWFIADSLRVRVPPNWAGNLKDKGTLLTNMHH